MLQLLYFLSSVTWEQLFTWLIVVVVEELLDNMKFYLTGHFGNYDFRQIQLLKHFFHAVIAWSRKKIAPASSMDVEIRRTSTSE